MRIILLLLLLPLVALGEETRQLSQIDFAVPSPQEFVRAPEVWFARTMMPFANFGNDAQLASFQRIAAPLANTPQLSNSQVILTKAAFTLNVAKTHFANPRLFSQNLHGFFPNMQLTPIPGSSDIRASTPLPVMARLALGKDAVECTMHVDYNVASGTSLGTGIELCRDFNVLFRASASQYEFYEVPGQGHLVVVIVRATSFVRQDTLNNFGPLKGTLIDQLWSRILEELHDFRTNVQKTLN